MARRKRKLKKTPIVLLLLIVGGVIAYFLLTDKSEVPDASKVIDKTKSLIEKKPEKKLQILDLNSNTRPYAVMINNVNQAWKYQAGLCNAYMEYTLLVEGGITRKMAVFKDVQDENIKIMSIRSSRHYYLDYALENDAIYVHWGWSPYAQSDIKTLKVNNINGLYYEGSYFLRDKEIKKYVSMEHRGYITIGNIKKAADKLKYRTTTEQKPLLTYSIDSLDYTKQENTKKADHIEIKYSGYYTSKYDYDTKTKKYKKTQNNTEMKDYNGTCELGYKNIITYQIPYSTIAGDAKGRQNATTVGSGTGYYISEGLAVPITWSKESRSARTVYKLADGTELKVNDGNTAIELQPKNQTLKIETLEEPTTTTTTTTKAN